MAHMKEKYQLAQDISLSSNFKSGDVAKKP